MKTFHRRRDTQNLNGQGLIFVPISVGGNCLQHGIFVYRFLAFLEKRDLNGAPSIIPPALLALIGLATPGLLASLGSETGDSAWE